MYVSSQQMEVRYWDSYTLGMLHTFASFLDYVSCKKIVLQKMGYAI